MGRAKAVSHPSPPAPRMQAHAAHAAPARKAGPAAAPIAAINPAIKAALSQQPPEIRSGVLDVAKRNTR